MSGFEFIFSLLGLILGLALSTGLSGLSRALKASHKVRIGWPTALLGLFVSCDVVTFWMYGWTLRDKLPVSWPMMFGGFLITAIYYVAVSLVFPDDPEDWTDLDGHFDKHRRKVLIGVLLCNLALAGTTIWLLGAASMMGFRQLVVFWSLFPVLLLAIWTRDRRVVVGCLLWLIALYPLSTLWHP